MSEDPAVGRAAALAALGQRRLPKGAAADLSAAADDPDARVRAAALGTLVRRGGARRAHDAWKRAVVDNDPQQMVSQPKKKRRQKMQQLLNLKPQPLNLKLLLLIFLKWMK